MKGNTHEPLAPHYGLHCVGCYVRHYRVVDGPAFIGPQTFKEATKDMDRFHDRFFN